MNIGGKICWTQNACFGFLYFFCCCLSSCLPKKKPARSQILRRSSCTVYYLFYTLSKTVLDWQTSLKSRQYKNLTKVYSQDLQNGIFSYGYPTNIRNESVSGMRVTSPAHSTLLVLMTITTWSGVIKSDLMTPNQVV
jgi:hypothetical protein